MSILRDDHSVARQEVLEAGWACVDHLEALAGGSQAGDFAPSLQSLAGEKRRQLERLEDVVREHGELPVLPDRDRETVEELVQRAEAALAADDGSRTALAQRRDAEQDLAALIGDRLQSLEFPDAERQVLEDLRQQARSAGDVLARLIDSDRSKT